ncbi:hypothetical protein NL676_021080 [Syzygium grande]|nr:hypothetical protein NL676_021080 [Syzygium grande]
MCRDDEVSPRPAKAGPRLTVATQATTWSASTSLGKARPCRRLGRDGEVSPRRIRPSPIIVPTTAGPS